MKQGKSTNVYYLIKATFSYGTVSYFGALSLDERKGALCFNSQAAAKSVCEALNIDTTYTWKVVKLTTRKEYVTVD